MTVGQDPGKAHRHNRGMLIAIFVLFFGGMLIAGLLRFSGWQPEGMKNKGEMLEPYADLREHTPTLAAGAHIVGKTSHASGGSWSRQSLAMEAVATNAPSCCRVSIPSGG